MLDNQYSNDAETQTSDIGLGSDLPIAVQAAEATTLVKSLHNDLDAMKKLQVINEEKFTACISKSHIQSKYFKEMFKNVSKKTLEAESIL